MEAKTIDLADKKKMELKDELRRELASKEDLNNAIENLKIELSSEIKNHRTETRWMFICLLIVIISLNKESLQFIATIFGMMK